MASIPRDSLGRWWFTYAMPAAGSFLAALATSVVLDASALDQVTLRWIDLVVFLATYVGQVLLMRRSYRSLETRAEK